MPLNAATSTLIVAVTASMDARKSEITIHGLPAKFHDGQSFNASGKAIRRNDADSLRRHAEKRLHDS